MEGVANVTSGKLPEGGDDPEKREMAGLAAGSVLVAIQTPENLEEHSHTDPGEAGQKNVSQSGFPGEVTFGEAAEGSGRRALTNSIIMETIANLLADKDLVALCLASKTTKKIVDQMDSSCWRKRAKKLQDALRMEATDLSTYKERYLTFKPEVEMLAKRMRGMIEENSGVIAVDPFADLDEDDQYSVTTLQELANIASLLYHDMLGEVSIKALELWDGNLSFIPPKQLQWLASRATATVLIGMEASILDRSVLLDHVKSDTIEIQLDGHPLGTDDTLALHRAMQTRVQSVFFSCHVLCSNMKALLRKYDGKGRCEEVRVLVQDSSDSSDSFDTTVVEADLRQLAQVIDWDVDVDDEDFYLGSVLITLKRRPQQQS